MRYLPTPTKCGPHASFLPVRGEVVADSVPLPADLADVGQLAPVAPLVRHQRDVVLQHLAAVAAL